MVYCGKPSRGCQMCRTRRIKCDETKPTCKQCLKSRRQCPGYKDDFDLVFRNETQATERRARRALGYGKKDGTHMFEHGQITFTSTAEGDASPDGGIPTLKPTADSGALSLASSVLGGLAVPIEQQASCFFLQNYVHTPRDPTSRGWFDFVAPLIKSESPDSHLNTAFSAVALATLANRPNTKGRGMMPQAINLYAKALKALNLALQNPSQQKSDSTLASILLLGFFETVTSERSNVMAWGSHVDGAVQLVKMRGKKQLRTKTGQALFITVRAQMLIHCMSASKPPLLGSEWWVIEQPTDRGAPTVKLLLRVVELRSEINTCLAKYPRTPEYFKKVLDLMRRAQSMEQEFIEWEDTVPAEWKVKTVAWVDNVPGGDITKADVCPGKVDMYQDIFIAALWNHSRISRLLLAGMVVRCAAWVCSPVNYRTTPEYATSVRIGADMVTDIIASVPFLLGWRVDEKGDLKTCDLSGFSSGQDDITSSKALGAFFLTWPLFCAICSDYATDSQRLWIKGRMNLISDVMGLNQAKTISSFQIRLPSMVIHRDNIGGAFPSAQAMAKIAMVGAPPAKTPLYIPPATGDNESGPKMTATAIVSEPKTIPPPPSAKMTYALNPMQQHLAMQKEAFEKEREILLKKASNFGGESAERVIGSYLSI